MNWKGRMRILFGSHMGMRRDDEKFFNMYMKEGSFV